MVWRCFQCGDSYDDRPTFCAGCGQTGSVYQLGRRARAEIDSALEIASAADPKARELEIEAELRALASPFRTAEAFGVEEIIDPRETRPYLCRFIDAAQGRLRTTLGPKPRFGVRP